MSDVERLLRSALVPIEPPASLTDHLEERLTELTDAAAEELADLDIGDMGDPRNWMRPVAAAAVVTVAGGALVVVRARQQARKREAHGLRGLEKSLEHVTSRVLKRFER